MKININHDPRNPYNNNLQGKIGDNCVKIYPRGKNRASNNPVFLTSESLKQYFNLKQSEAAKMLGVSVTTLKQACRNLNIPKWPYKKGNDVRSGQQPPEIGNTLTQHLNNGSIGGTPASRAETTVPYVPPLAITNTSHAHQLNTFQPVMPLTPMVESPTLSSCPQRNEENNDLAFLVPEGHIHRNPNNTDRLVSCEIINSENSATSLEEAKELKAQEEILKSLWMQEAHSTSP